MAHLALGPLFSPFIFIFLARQESAIRFAFPPTLPWTREIGLESSEVLWIGLDWIGVDWSGLEWTGVVGLDWPICIYPHMRWLEGRGCLESAGTPRQLCECV